MRTIAITNQKGGSGKTTTAVNLAAALAEKKRRVLLVDLDPQASASNWYAVRDADRGPLGVFTQGRALLSLVEATKTPGVDIVPASPWLMSVEQALAGKAGAQTILRDEFKSLPADRWHYLLVDCPPSLSLLTVNALGACREILAPTEAHVMALAGLAQLFDTVERARSQLNDALAITGILACRVDVRTRHSLEVVGELRQKFKRLVFCTVIRENVRLAEAYSFGQPITAYSPASRGAEDYRDLAREIVRDERNPHAKS